MEFPVILYRKHPNGAWPLAGHAGLHQIVGVDDAETLAAKLEAGWFLPGADAVPAVPADDAPPTRAELVQKAQELGLTFHHKTGDAKLAAMIAEALG